MNAQTSASSAIRAWVSTLAAAIRASCTLVAQSPRASASRSGSGSARRQALARSSITGLGVPR